MLLIHRNISPGAYDKTIELYRQCGVAPKIVPTQTMPYDEAGAILVESGKGIYVAVGKNPCHPSFADRLVALPLMEPAATIGVDMAWRKAEQAKVALDFVSFACKLFENVGAIVDMTRDADSILGLPLSAAERSSRITAQRNDQSYTRNRTFPRAKGMMR